MAEILMGLRLSGWKNEDFLIISKLTFEVSRSIYRPSGVAGSDLQCIWSDFGTFQEIMEFGFEMTSPCPKTSLFLQNRALTCYVARFQLIAMLLFIWCEALFRHGPFLGRPKAGNRGVCNICFKSAIFGSLFEI